MKVSIRGRKISIKLDPKSAYDQGVGNAYMNAMRDAIRVERELRPPPKKGKVLRGARSR